MWCCAVLWVCCAVGAGSNCCGPNSARMQRLQTTAPAHSLRIKQVASLTLARQMAPWLARLDSLKRPSRNSSLTPKGKYLAGATMHSHAAFAPAPTSMPAPIQCSARLAEKAVICLSLSFSLLLLFARARLLSLPPEYVPSEHARTHRHTSPHIATHCHPCRH